MADSMETICGMYMRKAIPGLYRISSYRAIGCRFAVLIRLALFLVSPLLLNAANPVGEQVVSGSISFDRTVPGVLTIGQGSERAIINWDDFSIGAGNLTQFLQPDASSAALNRVVGGNPSSIYGQLQANGQIFLINPAGILVGASGQVDTKGLVASTLDLSNESFLSNARLTLSGDSDAAVQNLGQISASGGNVYLIARSVDNSGSISASAGTVGLGGGSEVVLSDGGISVLAGSGSVDNSGAIAAASAELKAAGGNIYALAINNSGVVRANRLVNEGGRIVLKADGATALSSGTLSAASGEVQLLGGQVGLDGSIDVSGGGTALVGGGFQGNAPGVLNSRRTVVGERATINADAGVSGDGGTVVVWADDFTSYYGDISARGGINGGDGGSVEVSGKQNLAFNGGVDVGAANGANGSILLDPRDLAVVTSGADDASLSTTGLLAAAPNSTDDVTISAGAVSALNGNITLEATRDLSINSNLNLNNQTSGNTVAFTAGRHLTIRNVVKTAGASMTFSASSGGLNSTIAKLTILGPISGGDVTFANSGGSGGIVLASSIPNAGNGLTFANKASVGADLTLIGSDVTFSETLNGDFTANSRNLTVRASGTATFTKAVGNLGRFGELTLDGSGATAINGGTVFATLQNYRNPMTFGSNLILTGTDVRFESTVDAAITTSRYLNIIASGNTVFEGSVGASGGTISSLITNADGATSLNGGALTATTVTFNDLVTLAANTTLTGQTVTFGKRVDADLEANSRELNVTASGLTTFRGAIGSGPDGLLGTSDDSGLAKLTTVTGGSTSIRGGLVKSEVQTYGDTISVASNTTFSGATITFDNPLNSGGSAPVVTLKSTGVTTFNGPVGNALLGGLITDVTGRTVIRGATVRATTQTYNNPVTIGNITILNGSTVTFNDTVDGAAISEQQALTINAVTTVFESGATVGGNQALKSLVTDAAGTTTIKSPRVHAVIQQYKDSLVLGSNLTLTGSTVILKAVDGDSTANNRTLAINANLETTLNGNIGNAGILASLKTDPPGTTKIATGSISVTSQSYRDSVTAAGGATILKADENGAGTVHFFQAIDGFSNGAGVLNINATTTTFDGQVGSDNLLNRLATDAVGSTTFNGGIVKATTLTFNDPITVAADTTFGGSAANFNSTLDADAEENNRRVAVNTSLSAKFEASVGANEKLLTLETDAPGTLMLGAGGATAPTLQILTTGAQTYRDAAFVRADAPGVILEGASVEFQKPINADTVLKARELTVNTAGITRFGAAIGNSVRFEKVTTDAAGETQLNGTTMISKNFTFNDDVVLSKNATITATDGSVTFAKSLNGDATDTRTLTINATTTSIVGALGETASLRRLTTDAAGETTLAGGAIHATTLTFNDALVLSADTTLTGTTVNLNGTVDGNSAGTESLTINASGLTKFGANVGATTALASISTDAPGTSRILGTEVNAMNQSYGDDLTLVANTVLQATTGGGQASTVTFGKTILGNVGNTRTLEIKASGATTFGGTVGDTFQLLSLITDSGGTTVINTSSLRTTTQTYNDNVTIGADTTLTATTLTFAGTVDADATASDRDLTINASGVTTFTGVVGGNASFGDIISDSAGSTVINGGAVTGTTQVFNDPVTLGQNTVLSGSAITLDGTIDGASAATVALTANATTSLTLGGVIGGTASLASLASGNTGTTTIGSSSVTTSGIQTYGNVVTIGVDTTLTGSAVTFSDTVNADLVAKKRKLTVSSTGTKTFSGAVGETVLMDSLTVSGGGGVTISGGTVKVTTQNYSAETLTLGSDSKLEGTTVTFGVVSGNSKDLTVSASGTATFNGALSSVKDFINDSGGTTVIGANINTTGIQTYTDPVTLATDVTLTSTGSGINGDITVNSTVDGLQSLKLVSPGTATLVGSVGSTSVLTSLTLDNGAATTQTVLSGGVVTTSGAQSYSDNLTLLADTVFTGSAVTFPSTPANSDASGNDVTLNIAGSFDLGANFFAGTVNNLSISASSGVTVGAALTTVGRQTFSDGLTLSTDSTLSGTGATFSTITGATHDLTLNQTGVAIVGGTVSGVGALQTGTTGLTLLNVDLSVDSINFQNPVVLGGNSSLATTGTMGMKAIIGNGKNLTLNGTGNITLAGRVLGVAALDVTGVTTVSGGTGGGSLPTISTTGTQVYNSAVTLGADTSLKGTTVSFVSTVAGGGNDLDLDFSGGATTLVSGFGGGTIKNLSLANTGGGTTTISGSVTTTGTQSYKNAVTLGNGSITLTGVGISFDSSITGDNDTNDDLIITDTATTTLGGALTAVDTLTFTAGATETKLNHGTVTSLTAINLNSPVTLGADVTMTGLVTSSAAATINGNGDGTEGLTITGNAVIGGDIGTTASKALEFVSISGTTSASQDVTTTTTGGGTGNQTYTGAVTLGSGSITLTGSGISFVSSITGNSGGGDDLTITDAGTTSLGGALTAVDTLTFTAGATATQLNHGTVTSLTAINLNSPVVLGTDVTLTGLVTSIAAATINGTGDGTEGMTITGNAVIGGDVGTTASKALEFVSVSGTTSAAMDITTTTAGGGTGNQTYTGAVTLGDGSITLTGSGISFVSSITGDNGASDDLTVTDTGTTSLGGALTAVDTLTFTAGATATQLNDGTVTTLTAINLSSPVVLGTDVTMTGLVTSSAAATINGTGNGTEGMTITGNAVIWGDVGTTASKALEFVSVSGTTSIAADITSTTAGGGTGNHTYTGAVTLGDGSITLTGSGISFSSSITGDNGANDNLIVTDAGTTALGGALTAVDTLTFTAGATATQLNDGTVTTLTAINLNSPVVLGTDVTLTGLVTSAAAGTINGTGNGTESLTITGNAVIAGDVGTTASKALEAFSVSGTTTASADITSSTAGGGTGNQTYTGAVTLGDGSVTLTGVGISFNSTITGDNGGSDDLIITDTGITTLAGALTAVDTLTFTAGATETKLNDGTVTSLTAINLNSPVTLGTDVTLTGLVTTAATGTIDGTTEGTESLTITGNAVIGGDIGVAANKGLEFFSVSGTTSAGADITTSTAGGGTANHTYTSTVTLSDDVVMTGATPSFAATALVGAGNDLTLNFTGTTTIDSTFSGIKDFVTGNGGTTTLNGGTFTTTGSQTYSEVVNLGADTSLVGTTVSFPIGVGGAGNDLSLDFSGGATTLASGFGGGTIKNLSLANTSGGTTTISGSVTTTGTQTYKNAVTLESGSITLTGVGISFDSTITGNNASGDDLIITDTATTTLAGALTQVDNLTFTAGATATTLNHGTVSTITAINLNSPVTLGADVTLTGLVTSVAAGTINGNGNGTESLTITGNAVLGGDIGTTASKALEFLSVSGTTSAGADITTTTAGGGTGNQTYSSTVTLTGAVVMTGATPSFAATALVGAGNDLTLDFSGTTTIDNTFTGIKDFATGNGGGTTLNGGSFTTTATQTFSDALTLGAATTMTGTSITLDSLTGSGGDVTLDGTGTITLGGAVSSIAAFTVTDSSGTPTGVITINPGGSGIVTTGIQTYDRPITLGGQAIFNAGSADIIFEETITGGGQSLTLTTTGDSQLKKSATGLTTVTTSASGTTIFGSDGGAAVAVTSSGTQTYNDEVDSWVDATLTSTGSTIELNGGQAFPQLLGFPGASITTNP